MLPLKLNCNKFHVTVFERMLNWCPRSAWVLLAPSGICRLASSGGLSYPLPLQTWVGSCSVQRSARVCGRFAVKLLSHLGRKRGVGSATSVRAPVGLNSPNQLHLGTLPPQLVCRAMPHTLRPLFHLRSSLNLQSSFMKLPSCCCCLMSGSLSTWSFPHWCTTSPLHGSKRKNLRGRILLPLPCTVLAALTCFM